LKGAAHGGYSRSKRFFGYHAFPVTVGIPAVRGSFQDSA
jgi:hypothetical protein